MTKLLTTSTLIGLGLLAGACSPKEYHTRATINTEPLAIDQAMQQRQWEPITAYYENGSIATNSTGFAYEPRAGYDGYNGSAYYLTDAGTFFVNLVTLPYTLWTERDGVVSGGVVLPPTYTANPPLPASDVEPSAPTPAPTDRTPIDPAVAPTTAPSN